jgi:chromosome segregation ATPase
MADNHIIPQESIASTVMAIADIKESLNNATKEYLKDIKSFNIKIATIKEDIKKQQSKCDEVQKELDNIIKDMEYSKRLLQRLNENFFKKAEMIDEFSVEFAHTLDKDEFDKIHKRKLKDLILLTDEIEEVEQTLLEAELDRLNTLSKLHPLKHQLEELERYLLNIELEKEFVESTKLHDISKLNNKDDKQKQVVDVEVDSDD